MSLLRDRLKGTVLDRIRKDSISADFLCSIFISAAQSYRSDTVLRPFPKNFIRENGEKNFLCLTEAILEIPSIKQFSQDIDCVSDASLELLAWVLDNPTFMITTRDKSDIATALCKLTQSRALSPSPSSIFELVYSDMAEKKFQSLSGGRQTMYAYHGSRLDNFHSILHSGLAGHLNKNSLFGSGIYLSRELSMSLLYSHPGQGWARSQLGQTLWCVAVCQLIDDHSVKCTIHERHHQQVDRTRAVNSEAGDVPEKYYVVENNDMVRVKYLLVYSKAPVKSTAQSFMPSWLRINNFTIVITLYVLLLLLLGMLSSTNTQYALKKYLRLYGIVK